MVSLTLPKKSLRYKVIRLHKRSLILKRCLVKLLITFLSSLAIQSSATQLLSMEFGKLFDNTIVDLANIKLKPDQRPEDLYQCLMSFIEDNLLTRASGITHHGAIPEADEELSLSFENIVVYMWLQVLHPSLPSLFKQKYGTELRSRILASVKPEISQALDSLLDELHTSEEAKLKVMRTGFSNSGKPPQTPNHHSPSYQQLHPSKPKLAYRPRPTKSCTLCFQAGRPDHRSHFLSTCPYLPISTLLKYMLMTVGSCLAPCADIDDTPDYEENAHDDDDFPSSASLPYCDHNPEAIPQHVV